MTLENSAEFIYCQECANAWPLTDTETAFYFESTTTYAIGDYTSPALIAALGPTERMTFCPKCDTRELEPQPIPGAPAGVKGVSPFTRGDTKMIGANVDKGQKDPGDADVVHTNTEP